MEKKALLRGFLLAHSAPAEVLNALAELHEGEPVARELPQNLKQWVLSVRLTNILHYADIRTPDELMTLSESQLLRIPNMGRKSLRELTQYMAPLKLPYPTITELVYDKERGTHRYPRETE